LRFEVISFVICVPLSDILAHIPQLALENGLAFQANDTGNPAHISLRHPFLKIQRAGDGHRRLP
jgi:hypothetical protein